MKKHIVFDFDGTVLDTDQLIIDSWQAVFRRFRGEETAEKLILSTFGETVANTVQELFPEENAEEVMQVYRSYQQKHSAGAYRLYPGIRELLGELKEHRYKLSIVTSRLGNTTMQYLGEMGIKDKFDVIVTADDVTSPKPDPTPLLTAMDKLGVGRDESIMLGDTRFDIGCCVNAGVDSILVGWGRSCGRTSLRGLEPTYRIYQPGDLFEIIEG